MVGKGGGTGRMGVGGKFGSAVGATIRPLPVTEVREGGGHLQNLQQGH